MLDPKWSLVEKDKLPSQKNECALVEAETKRGRIFLTP
jgi:hypothetical protein